MLGALRGGWFIRRLWSRNNSPQHRDHGANRARLSVTAFSLFQMFKHFLNKNWVFHAGYDVHGREGAVILTDSSHFSQIRCRYYLQGSYRLHLATKSGSFYNYDQISKIGRLVRTILSRATATASSRSTWSGGCYGYCGGCNTRCGTRCGNR